MNEPQLRKIKSSCEVAKDKLFTEVLNISSGLVRYFALVPAVSVKFYFNVLHYNYSTMILFYSCVLKRMKTTKKKKKEKKRKNNAQHKDRLWPSKTEWYFFCVCVCHGFNFYKYFIALNSKARRKNEIGQDFGGRYSIRFWHFPFVFSRLK